MRRLRTAFNTFVFSGSIVQVFGVLTRGILPRSARPTLQPQRGPSLVEIAYPIPDCCAALPVGESCIGPVRRLIMRVAATSMMRSKTVGMVSRRYQANQDFDVASACWRIEEKPSCIPDYYVLAITLSFSMSMGGALIEPFTHSALSPTAAMLARAS